MLNSEIIRLMIPIFETYEYDWFGYKITEDNFLTAHHIKKRRGKSERGLTTADNIALLTNEAHRIINELEAYYPELYEECNMIFKKINLAASPPSEDIMLEIMNLRQVIDVALKNKPEPVKRSFKEREEIQKVFKELMKIFGNPQIDWMGYPVGSNNLLSYWHIIHPKDGGKTSIDNGALLTQKSQKFLSRVEINDPQLYSEYCYWLQVINDTKNPPSKDLIQIMLNLKKRLNTAIDKKRKKP